MADKEVTVPVPEERVAEFYAWFGAFLAAEPGSWPGRGGGRRGGPPGHGRRGRHPEETAAAWTDADGERAAWLYGRLAPAARELFDLVAASPGRRFSGNEVAARLGLEKGAHGVAGILAWPGRYCRHLGRALPIATEGRADGGTDYFMDPGVAGLFAGTTAEPGG
jgi:hypothetical protein